MADERAPRVGEIVLYRLSFNDVRRIAATTFSGNTHRPGDVVPLIVVRVWPNEFQVEHSVGIATDSDYRHAVWTFPKSGYGINGQAILDGVGTLWVTSAPHGAAEGFWDWKEGDCDR